MDLRVPLFANPQALHLVEPAQGTLHHPAMASQPLFRFHAPAGDAGNDVALPQCSAGIGIVVPLVTVHFRRTPARPASWPLGGEDGVDERQRLAFVVHVGSRQQGSQRQSPAVYDQMVLAARLPSVRGVRARLGPPFVARTLLESNEARLQSMSPFCPNSPSSTRWSFSKTPARLHSCSLLQHVTPLHPNTSAGRSLQAMPVLSTKMMPRRHALSSRSGRPLLSLRRRRGRSGSTLAHNSSGTNSRFMLAKMGTGYVAASLFTSEVHL
jgi:hypothetical protein